MALLFVSFKFDFDGRGDEQRVTPNGTSALVDCTRNPQEPALRKHERVWAILRQPAGQLGHFMVFPINGKDRVIDGSLPTDVDSIPLGAVEVTGELLEKLWHCNCGSHTFGCCYLQEVAKLRPRNFRAKRAAAFR